MANALVSLVEREAPFLAFTADKKKVVCTLNNHELPARMEAVEAFAKYVKQAFGCLHAGVCLLPRMSMNITSSRHHVITSSRHHVITCSGKKYRRLKARKATEDWADKYRPFLVPSVNFPNMMFCALTNHVIQKRRAVVEEHLKVCIESRR